MTIASLACIILTHEPQHNKDVIIQSLSSPNGIVCVVFATVALGMGVNFKKTSIE